MGGRPLLLLLLLAVVLQVLLAGRPAQRTDDAWVSMYGEDTAPRAKGWQASSSAVATPPLTAYPSTGLASTGNDPRPVARP